MLKANRFGHNGKELTEMGLNKRQCLQVETWRLIPNTARYILDARNPGSESSRGKLLMTNRQWAAVGEDVNNLSEETENKIINDR